MDLKPEELKRGDRVEQYGSKRTGAILETLRLYPSGTFVYSVQPDHPYSPGALNVPEEWLGDRLTLLCRPKKPFILDPSKQVDIRNVTAGKYLFYLPSDNRRLEVTVVNKNEVLFVLFHNNGKPEKLGNIPGSAVFERR